MRTDPISGEPQISGAEVRRRAERRAFVKAHHPDHGGDPDTFRTGLAAFDPVPRVVTPVARRPAVRRSRRVDRRLRRGWRTLRRRLRGLPPRTLL